MRGLVLSLLLLAAVPVYGSEPVHPLLPADTSSPRATLNSFVKNCNAAYNMLKTEGRNSGDQEFQVRKRGIIRNITRCLDVSEIAEFRRDIAAKEAAVSLKEALDRIKLPAERKIPDLKALMNEDGSYQEKWTVPNTEITFTRVKEGPLAGTYQFSPDTVARSAEFYERVKHLPYKKNATQGFAIMYLTSPGSQWIDGLVNWLPESMRDRKHGQAIWQWVGLIIVLLVSAAIMAVLYTLGRRVSRGGAEAGILKYILGLAFPILAIFVPIKAQSIITDELVISGQTFYIIKFNLALVALFAAMLVVLEIGKRAGEVISTTQHIAKRNIDAQLTRLITRMIGFLAAMVVLLEGGKHLGVPLSSLLAGAGVAGMALALSAQDMLKNVFGSIMLVMDKPFVVGERIQVKQYDGVVEEVGLRSTRIRLLNGHLVSMPNEELASTDIENIGRRPFIRRDSEIPLALDIPSAQAQKAVAIVLDILKDHEGFDANFPPRVWLSDFKRDHLQLKMIYWYHPPEYWKYTRHADKVNCQIIDAFNTEGIHIALPGFVTRVENESGIPVVPPKV